MALPDGDIEILGRSDFQIKVNGYRIEAGEVETRLVAVDAVKEAVVVRQRGAGGDRLVAHLVPAGWIDWSRRARSWDETVLHAAQWWAWDDPETPFGAHGFEGQRIIAFPARDLVVLRFGRSGSDAAPSLNAHLHEIARCFPAR